MQAREWMSEAFGVLLRILAVAMAWASVSFLVGEGWSRGIGILGLLGLVVSLMLLRKADHLVRFTYGRRLEPAIRQP